MFNIYHRHIQAAVGCAMVLLAGCALVAHDAELDNMSMRADKPSAERAAKQQATADLDCQTITTEILSRKDVEGAPLGPVWSNYLISTTGCGKSASYLIACKGTKNIYCFKKRK